jgi:hypothetical protein
MSHRVKVVLGPAKPGNDQSAYLFSLFLTNDFFLEVLAETRRKKQSLNMFVFTFEGVHSWLPFYPY